MPVAGAILALWTRKPDLYDPVLVGILCVGGLLSAVIQVPFVLPQLTNRSRQMNRPLALFVATLPMLGAPAAYLWGVRGLALALTFAEMGTIGAVSLVLAPRQFHLNVESFLTRTAVPGAAAMLLSYCVSAAACRLGGVSNLPQLIVSGALWCLLIAPFLFAGKIVLLRLHGVFRAPEIISRPAE
jgi:hypothetical protein